MRKKRGSIIPELLIERFAGDGKCLATFEDRMVFMPFVVPGDVVDAKILKQNKNWIEARATKFHQYSALRQEPKCTYFGNCGGCKWQMLAYEEQTKAKQQEIDELLSHHTSLEVKKVLPIKTAKHFFHYRNKLDFTFSARIFRIGEHKIDTTENLPKGALGFFAPKRYDKVININECFLMDEQHNFIRNKVYEIVVEQKLSFYDILAHKGLLRNLQIRFSANEKEWLVWVIFGTDGEEGKKKLFLQTLQDSLPFVQEIHYSNNTKWNDSTQDLEVHNFKGKGYITDKLGDLKFQIDAKSFFQTNSEQAEQLYQIALNFADVKETDVVYDLYCGVGTIGLFFARYCRKIIGIELISSAIKQAKMNALLNNIHHCSWIEGRVEDVINDDFVKKNGTPDIVLLDPPRAGLHPSLIKKLLQMEAPKIVYISCRPATQFRDLEMLSPLYEIEKMQAIDMFPQTHHIENVALLKRKKSE